MRSIRTLAAGLACVALLPAVGLAQGGRQFNDSWFWGAKGGVAIFKSAVEDISAPTAGLEWLVTRSHFGLNISVEQAFFETQAGVFDPTAPNSVRLVEVSDFRRYNVQMNVFPKAYGRLRPYAGLGVGVVVLRDATPTGSYASAESQDSVLRQIDEFSSRAAISVTAGVQAQLDWFSLFLQISSMPTRTRFLLNGSQYTNLVELGLRYNLVDAIEKMK